MASNVIFDYILSKLRLQDVGGGGEGTTVVIDQVYTINGAAADAQGNFTIDLEDLGGSPLVHTHVVADITGLTDALAAKAALNHTHNLVTGIRIGDTVLTNNIRLVAGNNVEINISGSSIEFQVNATVDSSSATRNMVNANNNALFKVFVGTAAEWTAFTKESGVKYMVCIVEGA